MRKILCNPHEQQLRQELEDRGLTDLIAPTAEEATFRARAHGFEPAVGALTSLLGNIANIFGYVTMALEGCPLCLAITVHAESCQNPVCPLHGIETWPAIAAEEQRQTWLLREREAGRS